MKIFNPIVIISGCLLLAISCKNQKQEDVRASQKKNIYAVPGTYEMDFPLDLTLYFDSLQTEGVARICFHDITGKDSADLIKDMHELFRYASGSRKYYPVREINKGLFSMAYELGYDYSHSGEDSLANEVYFYRYLEQTARLCPDITFLTQSHTSDQKAGILYYSEWSGMNPLYSFMIYKAPDKGFRVKMIGDKGCTKIEKIFQLDDNKGNRYYLCSCNENLLYFCQYLYRIDEQGDMKLISCYHYNREWNINSNLDYEISFNPSDVTWKFCKPKGTLLVQIEGTDVLKLHLNGDSSYFSVEK